tara:strand:+ start:420 stop:677 length:258 start_codon:yes stop_codon:yes gene_type:complete
MRKHTITIYSNDEFTFDNILREISFEITRKVFDRKNIKQRKFAGTWEEEVTSSSPLANCLLGSTETVAKWESNIVTEKQFKEFQK